MIKKGRKKGSKDGVNEKRLLTYLKFVKKKEKTDDIPKQYL